MHAFVFVFLLSLFMENNVENYGLFVLYVCFVVCMFGFAKNT